MRLLLYVAMMHARPQAYVWVLKGSRLGTIRHVLQILNGLPGRWGRLPVLN